MLTGGAQLAIPLQIQILGEPMLKALFQKVQDAADFARTDKVATIKMSNSLLAAVLCLSVGLSYERELQASPSTIYTIDPWGDEMK